MTTGFISAVADAVALKFQPSSAQKLYDLKAASEYLGLPLRSVYTLIRDGRIRELTLQISLARLLDSEIESRRSSMCFEFAYQATVAINQIRFAITSFERFAENSGPALEANHNY